LSQDAWFGNPGAQAAKESWAGYLSNVAFADEGMGQLFDFSKNCNVWDQFLIVWTSDHGDMNGDHYLWRKGYPWEKSAHVPMMMQLPPKSTIENQQGFFSSAAIVENRDVAPTLYDYLGILQDVQQRYPLMDGKRLLPILTGQQEHICWWLDLEHANTIHWNAIVGYHISSPKQQENSIQVHFHAHDGTEQLFCLTEDPNESYDLATVDVACCKFGDNAWSASFSTKDGETSGSARMGNCNFEQPPHSMDPIIRVPENERVRLSKCCPSKKESVVLTVVETSSLPPDDVLSLPEVESTTNTTPSSTVAKKP
jgi:hypothetical protein